MTEFDCFMDEVMVIGQGMGGNPDWNQNDDTAHDYIKNRTHYSYNPNIEWDGVIEPGQPYISMPKGSSGTLNLVKVSDNIFTEEEISTGVFECTIIENNEIVDIFDLSFVEVHNITERGTIVVADEWGDAAAFIIYDSELFVSKADFTTLFGEITNGLYMCNFIDADLQYITSSISFPEVVKKIDKKYLFTPNWKQNDSTQSDYIANRTHFDITLEDIENKGGYTETFIGTWPCQEGYYFKVSDLVLPMDILLAGVKYEEGGNSGMGQKLLTDEDVIVYEDLGMIGCGNLGHWGQPAFVVVYDERKATHTHQTNITNGIYFGRGSDPSSDADAWVTKIIFPEAKKLDEKYLPEFSEVAKSGSYNDLLNKPNVYTKNEVYTKTETNQQIKDAMTNISIGDLNILNDKGLNSLHQKLDPKYTHIQILSKNPLIGQLGDDILTNEEYNGASGQYASAFGGASSAQGKRSAAFGTNTVAKGNYSFCCGDNSVTLGNDSFACCYANVAYGTASFAAGSGNLAYGQASFAIGSACKAVGDASFAGGTGSVSVGTHSIAFGNNVWTRRDNSVAFGSYNRETDAIFSVGNGNENHRESIFEIYSHGNVDNGGEEGAYFNGCKLATEDLVINENNRLRKEVKNKYGRKSVSGEILEIKDLNNPFNATVTSTVTDNYFYKENYIKSKKTFGYLDYCILAAPNLYLKNDEGNLIPLTITRSKFADGFVNEKTAYIIFETPEDVTSYEWLVYEYKNNADYPVIGCEAPIKPLKSKHSYMLIINLSDRYEYDNASSYLIDATVTYLVDYEDSYHWVKGQDTASIPFPYTIMIPHVGRIDKGDTLTIEYQCSEAAGLFKENIDSLKEEIMEYIKSKIG